MQAAELARRRRVCQPGGLATVGVQAWAWHLGWEGEVRRRDRVRNVGFYLLLG